MTPQLSCANTAVPNASNGKSTRDESRSAEVKRAMASVLYECASQEKMEMLPAWIEIFRQASERATLNPHNPVTYSQGEATSLLVTL